MLAQNFRTAADLGIKDEQRAALITLLGMLERGEIVHQTVGTRARDYESDLRAFNMMEWDCGSAACLGGWCEHIAERDFPHPYPGEGIRGLFYPDDEEGPQSANYDYDAITTEQAATALRNYLTTGRPRWADNIESA
jgi:hypothetical protein